MPESRRERARRISGDIDARRRDDHQQQLGLRARLQDGETILALARDMPTVGDERSRASASATGLAATTDQRVLWRELDERGRSEPREIRLDEVIAAESVSEHHRWHLELEHGPIERITHVPAYHVGFIAGGNKLIRRSWRRSSFAFSRRDAEMAVALRAELARRGIEIHEHPPSPTSPRESRIDSVLLTTTGGGRRRGRRMGLLRSRATRGGRRSRGDR